MMISETEINLIDSYSRNLDMQDIGLFWQLTIKTLDDLKIVANENLTLEMYIMQLVHLKNISKEEEQTIETKQTLDLESYNDNTKAKQEEINEKNSSGTIKNQIKNTRQIKENIEKTSRFTNKLEGPNNINSFQDLIEFAT